MEWKNLRNERIRFAYDCVCYVNTKLEKEDKQKYRKVVRGYGASVHRQSLLQDLSGRISNIKDEHNSILVIHILTWLFHRTTVDGLSIEKDTGQGITADKKELALRLYEIMLCEEEDRLPYHTQEACQLVDRIKEYAEAILPSGDEENEGGSDASFHA